MPRRTTKPRNIPCYIEGCERAFSELSGLTRHVNAMHRDRPDQALEEDAGPAAEHPSSRSQSPLPPPIHELLGFPLEPPSMDARAEDDAGDDRDSMAPEEQHAAAKPVPGIHRHPIIDGKHIMHAFPSIV
jgi:hypothetical protein